MKIKITKRKIIGYSISAAGLLLTLGLAPLGFHMKDTLQALFIVSLSIASTSSLFLGIFIAEEMF